MGRSKTRRFRTVPTTNYTFARCFKPKVGDSASSVRRAAYDRLLSRYMASPLGSDEARELLAELRRTKAC